MATQQTQCFCQVCNRQTLHTRNTLDTNHLVHALVTLFLCGCWFPVWLIVDMSNSSQNTQIPWRCNTCGQAFGQLTAAQLAARNAARMQIASSAAHGAGTALSHGLQWLELWLIKLWQLAIAAAKRAPTLAVSIPARIDTGLASVAGDGNAILHWFLRILAVVLAAFLAGGAVGLLL